MFGESVAFLPDAVLKSKFGVLDGCKFRDERLLGSLVFFEPRTGGRSGVMRVLKDVRYQYNKIANISQIHCRKCMSRPCQ